MKTLRIETITYNLEKGGPQYRGLLVNEGMGPILDEDGKEIPQVWDYKRDNRFVVEVDLGATGV